LAAKPIKNGFARNNHHQGAGSFRYRVFLAEIMLAEIMPNGWKIASRIRVKSISLGYQQQIHSSGVAT
jgi:hypothetical protein